MAVDAAAVRSLIPLRTPVFHILLALGAEDMHGYGIMQSLKEKTDGRDSLLPGTLYATIARMEAKGLITEVDPPAGAMSGGPSRRYYRRTALGTAVTSAESERLQRLLRIASSEDLLPEPAG